MAKIESLSKQRLRYLRRLKLKKHRQKEGLFLIEGRRLIETAIASDWTVDEIYLAQDALEGFLKSKLGESIALQKIPLFSTDRKEINSLCETETPQGVLGLARAKKFGLDDLDDLGGYICDRSREAVLAEIANDELNQFYRLCKKFN